MEVAIDIIIALALLAISYGVIVGLVRAFYPRVPKAPEPFDDSKDWGSQ